MLQKDGMIDRLEERLKRLAKIKVTEIDEASLLTAEEYEKLLEEA